MNDQHATQRPQRTNTHGAFGLPLRVLTQQRLRTEMKRKRTYLVLELSRDATQDKQRTNTPVLSDCHTQRTNATALSDCKSKPQLTDTNPLSDCIIVAPAAGKGKNKVR